MKDESIKNLFVEKSTWTSQVFPAMNALFLLPSPVPTNGCNKKSELNLHHSLCCKKSWNAIAEKENGVDILISRTSCNMIRSASPHIKSWNKSHTFVLSCLKPINTSDILSVEKKRVSIQNNRWEGKHFLTNTLIKVQLSRAFKKLYLMEEKMESQWLHQIWGRSPTGVAGQLPGHGSHKHPFPCRARWQQCLLYTWRSPNQATNEQLMIQTDKFSFSAVQKVWFSKISTISIFHLRNDCII